MRKISSTLLAASLALSTVLSPLTVFAATKNLALNKPVEVSGIEGGYLDDGTLKYPHIDPVHLTDGDLTTRWGSDTTLVDRTIDDETDQSEWCVVDLEQEYDLGKIVLYWERGNSRNYDIQISLDGESWSILHHYEDPDLEAKAYTETLELDTAVRARYIRVYARLGNDVTMDDGSLYECKSISLYEIEAYELKSQPDAEDVLNTVLNMEPTLNEDGTRLILPDPGLEDCTVHLASTSNPAVVDTDGNITQPLQDMNVNLFYEIEYNGETVLGDDPKTVTIAGKYEQEENDNEKPGIVPEIREWKGFEGTFTYSGVIHSDNDEAAEIAAMYIEEMSGIPSEINDNPVQAGDIVFKTNPDSVLGEEGYEIEIGDVLEAEAVTYDGLVYAAATISQMLYLSDDQVSAPKGLIRDYPQYEIRSVMLDVARQYIPIDYLEEMTKYAGYLKLSEFRCHINDNGGEQTAAFRVESKVYPELNTGITYYTQDEYKAYQKAVKKFGVDVVTEIDTPAHAGAFAFIDSSLLMDGYHLDLRTEEAYQRSLSVVEEVLDEMLDGDDPVFQNGKFHIGTDEYDKTYSEVVRRYINDLATYVNEKGYSTRFWASLGSKGFAGETEVTTDLIAHMWSHSWASFDEMKEAGYKFVNNKDGTLYIVPWAGYNDTLNIKNLYGSWEYSDLGSGYTLKPGHPQLLGAEAALWYDIKVGASEFDIFYRLKDQIALMAEKGWYGEDDDQTGEQFVNRVNAVGTKTPQSNAARVFESEDELVAQYSFDEMSGNTIEDQSSNGYDALVSGTSVRNGALRLNGSGFVSLPFDSIGYPYTASIDLTVDSATPANSLIFEGKDGKLFWNYDNTGKIGYERKGYSYLLDYEPSEGIRTTLTLSCDWENCTLYVNGMSVGTGEYYKVTGASKQASTTFVLPTEKIGSGLYGWLYGLSISNVSAAGISSGQSLGNVALNKPVEVSGVEGGVLDDGTLKYPQFDPQHATDGDLSTRISLETVDEAWLTVDLEQEYLLDHVILRFGELPSAWDLQVSDDNENWTTVSSFTNLAGGTSKVETISFGNLIKARYVRYQQRAMWLYSNNNYYSGNFKEFEVYATNVDTYEKLLDEYKEQYASLEVSEENEDFLKEIEANINKMEELLNTGPIETLDLLSRQIADQLALAEAGTIPAKTDKSVLENLIQEKLDESSYESASWNKYVLAVSFGKQIYYQADASQKQVDQAVSAINEAKSNLIVEKDITITSNKNIYQDYALDNLIDGDTTTAWWANSVQKFGDYVLFTFRTPRNLNNVKIYATGCGSDKTQDGAAEVLVDGTWKTVASIGKNDLEDLDMDEPNVSAFRLRIVTGADYWWKLTEVVFNNQPEQDKARLNHELSIVLNEEDYTEESWSRYTEARTSAQAVMDDNTASQKTIDAAFDSLSAARSSLVKVVVWSELESLLDEENRISPDGYTEESYASYISALEYGQSLLEERTAAQKEVDLAVWNIEEAIALLEEQAAPADKSLLAAAIAYAQAVKENDGLDGVNETVVSLFETRLAAAIEVNENDAAAQEEVDQAWKDLSEVIQMLEFTSHKSELAQLVAECESMNLENYEPDGQEEFLEALEYAREVLNNPYALDDQSIQAAYNRLNSAKNALVSRKVLDTSVLEFLIAQCEKADLDAYRNAGKEDFQKALSEAKAVAANPSCQEEIDAAAAALHQAWLNLRLKPDEALLKVLQDFVNLSETLDRSLYKASTWQIISDAAQNARSLLNKEDVTDAELESAVENLKSVMNLINNPDAEKTENQISSESQNKQETVAPSAGNKEEKTSSTSKSEESVKNESVKTSVFENLWFWTAAAAAALIFLRRIKAAMNK